jgi:serine/threonine-protein kinase RsbW
VADRDQQFILVLNSTPSEIVKVEEFLVRVAKRLKLDETQFNKLLVATTEAVNNGIIHGNQRDSSKKVTLSFEVNHATLVIRVKDEGHGVDPSKLPDPLAEENLLRENGRGVFLMRSLMDSVEFEHSPEGSEVTMRMTL